MFLSVAAHKKREYIKSPRCSGDRSRPGAVPLRLSASFFFLLLMGIFASLPVNPKLNCSKNKHVKSRDQEVARYLINSIYKYL